MQSKNVDPAGKFQNIFFIVRIPYLKVLIFFPILLSVLSPAFPIPPDDSFEEDIDIEDIASDSGALIPRSGSSDSSFSSQGAYRHGSEYSFPLKNINELADDTRLEEFLHEQEWPGVRTKRKNGVFGSFRSGFKYKDETNDPYGKYWNRYIGGYKDRFVITLLQEHDPGESHALDFTSGSVTIPFKAEGMYFIVGDFRPSVGEGLVFSKFARRYRSGTDIVSGHGSTANMSFEEARFLRGLFVQLTKKRYSAQAWASNRNVDGIEDDSGEIVGLDQTGLHTSVHKRSKISERIAAVNLSVLTPGPFVLTTTGAISDYSSGFVQRAGERYSNDPDGNEFQHFSISGRTLGKERTFFFEHALMNGGADATTAGVRVAQRGAAGIVLARSFDRHWWAPRSGAVSTFGDTSNERGVYAAMDVDITSSTKLSTSADLARTMGRTYLQTMPVSRRSICLGVEKKAKRNGEIGLMFRSTGEGNGEPERWSVRMRHTGAFAEMKNLRYRAMLAWSASGGHGGTFCEMGGGYAKKVFRFDLDADIFSIPSYSARYYRYERDVPGRGASLPVWGKGGACTLRMGTGLFSMKYRFVDADLMSASHELTVQGDWIY